MSIDTIGSIGSIGSIDTIDGLTSIQDEQVQKQAALSAANLNGAVYTEFYTC